MSQTDDGQNACQALKVLESATKLSRLGKKTLERLGITSYRQMEILCDFNSDPIHLPLDFNVQLLVSKGMISREGLSLESQLYSLTKKGQGVRDAVNGLLGVALQGALELCPIEGGDPMIVEYFCRTMAGFLDTK